MPIYEYECKSCSHRFEERGNYDSEGNAICPNCKGKAFRVFSPASIKFAGSGYYASENGSASSSCGGSSTFRGFG